MTWAKMSILTQSIPRQDSASKIWRFPSSRGGTPNHPVVMDDHDFVLKPRLLYQVDQLDGQKLILNGLLVWDYLRSPAKMFLQGIQDWPCLVTLASNHSSLQYRSIVHPFMAIYLNWSYVSTKHNAKYFSGAYSYSRYQWIGLRRNLNRKPQIFALRSWGFPVSILP